MERQGVAHPVLETFDVIHGHLLADKYAGLFPPTDFVAFFLRSIPASRVELLLHAKQPDVYRRAKEVFAKQTALRSV